jgi:hypothetical protein
MSNRYLTRSRKDNENNNIYSDKILDIISVRKLKIL